MKADRLEPAGASPAGPTRAAAMTTDAAADVPVDLASANPDAAAERWQTVEELVEWHNENKHDNNWGCKHCLKISGL